MIEIYDDRHKPVGESVVCVARKVGRSHPFDNSNKHRSNRVVVNGTDRDPAEAYIRKIWRTKRDG